jgi:monoamine oxidase
MFAAHMEAERRGMPVEELLGVHAQRDTTYTRRGFLAGGAGLLAGAALAARPQRSAASKPPPGAPRIAIVGAGLAGLRCAHMLWLEGRRGPIATTVYEANPERVGGRCWTLRGFFDGGLTTEHGGEFINSNQTNIRRLAAQLGLEEEEFNGGDLPHGEEAFWIDGAHYSEAEASADWKAVGYRAFKDASHEMRSPVGLARLDSMSVPEWLDSTEIGSSSRLGKLLMSNTVSENGGNPSEQSALDMIELTARSPRRTLDLLPGDNEKFHIVGGNDQLVSRMVAELPPQTVLGGHELVALRENPDTSTTLVFDVAGAGTSEVSADVVVLALPFSTLRNVNLSRSGFSPIKQTVIQTLGMGSNAKIHLELERKTWPALGFAGAAYGEWDGFSTAWDDSVPLGPDASPTLLLAFPGGERGRTGLTGQAHGVAPAADVDWFLGEIEPVFPGTSAVYTGRAYEDHWALDPWVLGAYSYYRIGQAADYGELAAASEGRVHFAGEHTAGEQQGFLDGAVVTGERAARAVMHQVGRRGLA